MAKEDSLAKEIEELEKGVFGNPAPEATAETVETEVKTEETEVAPATEQPTEEPTEPVIETTTQEDLTKDETVHTDTRPTRTNWKKKFLEMEKRFRGLKSSNDGTIFQLRTDLTKALNAQNNFSNKVDELSKRIAELNSSKGYDHGLSEEEVDILGSDTVQAMEKMSKARIDAEVNPLREQLEQERARRLEDSKAVAVTNQQQANLNFLSRLGEIVPDYEVIDTDPAFIKYMEEGDQFSGTKREVLFKQAQTVGDVGRVAQFFQDYIKIKNEGEAILESKVTPTTSSSDAVKQTQPPTKQVITIAQIDKFQADVAKGRYNGKQKLQQEIEAEINQAYIDRRIAF